MDDVVDLVGRSLSGESDAEFRERIAEQADQLRDAIEAGTFDNEDFAVGLEVEVYAIDAEPEPATDDDGEDEPDEATLDADLSGGSVGDLGSLEPAGEDAVDDSFESDGDDEADEPYMDPDDWEGRLAELPESIFGTAAAKELGVHNAEINTDPDVLGPTGLAVQTTSIEMRIKKARDAAREANRELVLDAMWTIPPAAGSVSYLSDVEERDGFVFAENMRQDPRYVALDNEALGHAGGEIDFSVPGASHSFPTILFESLTASIQPHLQIPDSDAFPAYYNAAIRTLGPMVALTANSPLLPADMYDAVEDPRALLEDTHHELRIAAFEQSVNTSENPKVRVPSDIETTTEVVDRVVEDDLFAPFLREWIEDGTRSGLHDTYWEFDHKRGTYWRWLRCVIGGDPVDGAGDERSLRIEYRPIPTQPTVADTIAVQVLTAGLLRGLVVADHPLAELPWQDAEASFYSAAREGPDADLAWVTADGQRTTDHDAIYDEVFEYARRGLASQDVPESQIDEMLAPIERRRALGTTPSQWKLDRVGEYLSEHDLPDAICEAQRDYYELSREHDTFADWL
ncbi:hypothetical protein ACAH01_13880 [Halomicrobium sp. HM KBTZ05]|uniref:hypothetical protein n=1 Tax=Halomicrobium sp. HM KBTZ05 TaxID=3242663 RepID=UPI003558E09D